MRWSLKHLPGLCLMLVLVGCSKKNPTEPPPPGGQALSGHFVFSMLDSNDTYGSGEIYRQRADGTGRTRLTTNAVDDCHPRWSPDGTKIAFLRGVSASYDVFVMSEDGSGVQQLTFNGAVYCYGNHHWWSPDGTRLLIAELGGWVLRSLDGSPPDTLVAASDTSTIGTFPDGGPWSPDGAAVAYDKGGGSSPGVYVCTLSPRGHRFVFADGYDPSWSADGSRILFLKGGEHWSVTATGTDLHPCPHKGDLWLPSPTSTELAYAMQDEIPDNDQMWLMDFSSCAARALLTFDAEPVQWSRDGRYLVYREYVSPDSERIGVVEVATGRVQVVFDEVTGRQPLRGFVDWKP